MLALRYRSVWLCLHFLLLFSHSAGENVDVKALRARFNNHTIAVDSSSQESSSPRSPRPGFGKAILPVTENDLVPHRLSPTAPSPPMAGPGPGRFPRIEPAAAPIPSRSTSSPWTPPHPGARPAIQPPNFNKVKHTGEILQTKMMKHPKPPGLKPAPAPPQAPTPATASGSLPPRRQPQQRATGDVTPLRRPLPPEGPLPLKPKRPPKVNLEPFRRFKHRPMPPEPTRPGGSTVAESSKMPLPSVISPPKPPQRSSKPCRLPRQVASIDIDNDQEAYDDIASFEKDGSWSDSSQCINGDNEEVYESIDEDQVEVNLVKAKKNSKDTKSQWEPENRSLMEQQKKENELRKKFQLDGEVEVLHTARVRHDWNGGGPLDLSVQQDEKVDILRVKNNPGGKWLARSPSGNYGYISNTCVDVDYEAVKRSLLKSQKVDTSLPPPPPDPPLMVNMDSRRDSTLEDDDDYDDVEPLPEDFPPPPPEVSVDPKVVRELKKKFKYEGSLRALHTMMVDPNGTIKKPGGRDLPVIRGEILDVIQLTSSKKALCRNQFGKYGYVSRSLLLQMEGDIYDDVDYPGDIYDNDTLHPEF